MKIPRSLRAGLGLVLLTVGCGYHLMGHSTVLPPGINSIGVPTFINKTDRPEVEQRITSNIISEFVTRSDYRITADELGVDAVLRGEILLYLLNPVTISAAGRATRYEIIINAKATLVQTSDDKILWQDDHVIFRRQYAVGSLSVGTVTEETAAIEQMSSDFAKSVVTSILEGF